jgi:hypothetical protein
MINDMDVKGNCRSLIDVLSSYLRGVTEEDYEEPLLAYLMRSPKFDRGVSQQFETLPTF